MAQQAVRVLHPAGRLHARHCRRRLGQRLHPADPLHVASRATESPAGRALPLRLLRLRDVGAHHSHYQRLRAKLLAGRPEDVHDHVLSAGK